MGRGDTVREGAAFTTCFERRSVCEFRAPPEGLREEWTCAPKAVTSFGGLRRVSVRKDRRLPAYRPSRRGSSNYLPRARRELLSRPRQHLLARKRWRPRL